MTAVPTDPVIDLRAHVIAVPERRRRPTPLHELTDTERRRVLVRVLCELVAYREPEGVGRGYGLSARNRAFSASHRAAVPPPSRNSSSAFHSGAS